MTTIARFDFVDALGEVHKNDIKLDPATGSIAMCAGIEAYAQTLEAVIKTVKGELITNQDYGVPYFTTIFDSRVYADEWAEAVKNIVASLDFISSIDLFEYEYDQNRKIMTYRLEVTTTNGEQVQVVES